MPQNEKRRIAGVRKNLLALRGEAEMTVLRGARALELICHGRYQKSLRFDTPRAQGLIDDNSALLESLAAKLEELTARLEKAAAYDGPTDEELAADLTDHSERVPKLRQMTAKWRSELED